MNYKQLAEAISKMSDEQLQSTVTVKANDEYFAAKLNFEEEDDVLDKDHLFLLAIELIWL